MATPLAIPIIASVVRKDGMPTRVVSSPLKRPAAIAVRIPAQMPNAIPPAPIASAVVTDARPATAPTERSISPAESTNVIATAMTDIMAVCLTMLRRLVGSRKPRSCSVTAKKMKIARKPR
jgi:hypothetical protein